MNHGRPLGNVTYKYFQQRAKAVYDSKWSGGLSHAPYLKTSPAAPFLKRYVWVNTQTFCQHILQQLTFN